MIMLQRGRSGRRICEVVWVIPVSWPCSHGMSELRELWYILMLSILGRDRVTVPLADSTRERRN